MIKWLVAIILIPVLAYASGLRIDFKLLMDKLQHKTDHNTEALLKMGIDPNQIEFKGKPWWTFKPEDNLFRKLPFAKFDLVKQMSDESWETSQAMKKKLGPSPVEEMGQAMATQTRMLQQRMQREAQMQQRQ